MIGFHPGKIYSACGGKIRMCLSGHQLIANAVGRPSFTLLST